MANVFETDEYMVKGNEATYEPTEPPGGGTDLDSLDSSTNDMADADLIVSKETGGTAWVKKTASKLWDYIKGKIGISNGGSANKFLNEQGTFTVVNSGKIYDVEMSSDLDEMTLTEDGTDKTTLPLVATFVGTHQEWNALSAAEQAKYRRVDFTDDGGFGTAYQIPYENSNVGDTLTELNSALSDARNYDYTKPLYVGDIIFSNHTYKRYRQCFGISPASRHFTSGANVCSDITIPGSLFIYDMKCIIQNNTDWIHVTYANIETNGYNFAISMYINSERHPVFVYGSTWDSTRIQKQIDGFLIVEYAMPQ